MASTTASPEPGQGCYVCLGADHQSSNCHVLSGQAVRPTRPGDLGRYKEIEAVFKQFDKDDSGSIDLVELDAACHALRVHMDEEQLREMMEVADTDGSSGVEFDEFLELVLEHRDDQHSGALWSCVLSAVDKLTSKQMHSIAREPLQRRSAREHARLAEHCASLLSSATGDTRCSPSVLRRMLATKEMIAVEPGGTVACAGDRRECLLVMSGQMYMNDGSDHQQMFAAASVHGADVLAAGFTGAWGVELTASKTGETLWLYAFSAEELEVSIHTEISEQADLLHGEHRTEPEAERLVDWLKCFQMHPESTKGLSRPVRHTLTKGLTLRKFAPGDVVCSPGDAIDALYLITHGSIHITSAEGRTVTTLSSGRAFGEQLFCCDFRETPPVWEVTGTAEEGCTVAVLTAKVYETATVQVMRDALHLLSRDIEPSSQSEAGVLRQLLLQQCRHLGKVLRCFKRFPHDVLERLALTVRLEEFEAGDELYRECFHAEKMYILLSGALCVQHLGNEDGDARYLEHQYTVSKIGSVLGAVAFVDGSESAPGLYTESVLATESSQVAVLTRAALLDANRLTLDMRVTVELPDSGVMIPTKPPNKRTVAEIDLLIDVIRTQTMTARMTLDQCSVLAREAKVVGYGEGEILAMEDKPQDGILLLLSGSLDVVLGQLEPGEALHGMKVGSTVEYLRLRGVVDVLKPGDSYGNFGETTGEIANAQASLIAKPSEKPIYEVHEDGTAVEYVCLCMVIPALLYRKIQKGESTEGKAWLYSRVNSLKAVEVFGHFNQWQLEDLAEALSLTTWNRGDMIATVSEHVKNIFILLQGKLMVVSSTRTANMSSRKTEKSGAREYVVGTIVERECIGLKQMMEKVPYRNSIKVSTPTATLYAIPAQFLETLIGSNRRLQAAFGSHAATQEMSFSAVATMVQQAEGVRKPAPPATTKASPARFARDSFISLRSPEERQALFPVGPTPEPNTSWALALQHCLTPGRVRPMSTHAGTSRPMSTRTSTSRSTMWDCPELEPALGSNLEQILESFADTPRAPSLTGRPGNSDRRRARHLTPGLKAKATDLEAALADLESRMEFSQHRNKELQSKLKTKKNTPRSRFLQGVQPSEFSHGKMMRATGTRPDTSSDPLPQGPPTFVAKHPARHSTPHEASVGAKFAAPEPAVVHPRVYRPPIPSVYKSKKPKGSDCALQVHCKYAESMPEPGASPPPTCTGPVPLLVPNPSAIVHPSPPAGRQRFPQSRKRPTAAVGVAGKHGFLGLSQRTETPDTNCEVEPWGQFPCTSALDDSLIDLLNMQLLVESRNSSRSKASSRMSTKSGTQVQIRPPSKCLKQSAALEPLAVHGSLLNSEYMAAVEIQRVQRGIRTRQALAKMAAKEEQQVVAQTDRTRHQIESKKAEIQLRMVQRDQAREAWQKQQREAAVAVPEVGSLKEKKSSDEAASIIQRNTRRRQAEVRARLIQRKQQQQAEDRSRRKAATAIQRIHRGWAARKKQRELGEDQQRTRAAITIQRVHRGSVSRGNKRTGLRRNSHSCKMRKIQQEEEEELYLDEARARLQAARQVQAMAETEISELVAQQARAPPIHKRSQD